MDKESKQLKERVENLEIKCHFLEVELHEQKEKLRLVEENVESIMEQRKKDFLTGLLSKMEFQKFLESEKPIQFGIIAIDVDNFKSINSIYGHSNGDVVLKEVAKTIKKSVRAGTDVYRVGGEEFVITVPLDNSKKRISNSIAERVRKNIESLNITVSHHQNKKNIKVTASFGVAYKDAPSKSVEETYKEADNLLLKAKKEGKNRVEEQKSGN